MNDAKEPQTFEQALGELERIVRDLEDGKTGLEESLKRCYGQLRQAEHRIIELTGTDAAGNPVTKLFEHVATVSVVKDRTGG
jgi:exodeoxyribonuclease VII small subunit